MQDNIGQMLSNIERSQTLKSTTEGLAQTATQFNRAAQSTRKHFWWQNFKVKLALGGGCLLLLIIILASSGAFPEAAGTRHLRRRLPPTASEGAAATAQATARAVTPCVTRRNRA